MTVDFWWALSLSFLWFFDINPKSGKKNSDCEWTWMKWVCYRLSLCWSPSGLWSHIPRCFRCDQTHDDPNHAGVSCPLRRLWQQQTNREEESGPRGRSSQQSGARWQEELWLRPRSLLGSRRGPNLWPAHPRGEQTEAEVSFESLVDLRLQLHQQV